MRARVLVFALLACAAGGARAQDVYPSQTITLIVPFAPGGTPDVLARFAAEELGATLGQRMVVENAGGASGTIAMARAARAEPNGYTLMIGNPLSHAASYFLYKNLTYTPQSFAPAGLIAKTAPVIILRTGFPARTLRDFVAYSRKYPGQVSLGHAGAGSASSLVCRLFVAATGADVNLVSYRNAALALHDTMAGHIDGSCESATAAANPILMGKVLGLVAGASAAPPNLPDLPAAADAGFPQFQAETWNALFAPAGTPDSILSKLNVALRQAAASPELRKRLLVLSSVPAKSEELEAAYTERLVASEIEKYRKLLTE